MTHPAQHLVDASKKRQREWVEGRARGGRADRPGKKGALKGGASEDRETQSDTLPLVPHIRSGKFPVADTVAAAEGQKNFARGGRAKRADGGETGQMEQDDDNRLLSGGSGSQPMQHATPPQEHDKVSVRAKGGAAFRTPSGSVSEAARKETESKGEAMKGGRFPIRNASDLANAKHDYGRANDKPAVKRWIDKRARALGEPPLGG